MGSSCPRQAVPPAGVARLASSWLSSRTLVGMRAQSHVAEAEDACLQRYSAVAFSHAKRSRGTPGNLRGTWRRSLERGKKGRARVHAAAYFCSLVSKWGRGGREIGWARRRTDCKPPSKDVHPEQNRLQHIKGVRKHMSKHGHIGRAICAATVRAACYLWVCEPGS